MGLTLTSLRDLLQESARRPFMGAILQLGRQDIWFGEAAMHDLAASMGVPLAPVERPLPPLNPDFLQRGCISDDHLFRALGFEAVHALDFCGYEGADLVFDLNRPDPPSEWEGRFDFILNGGTLEHVFHLPNALNTVFRLLKVGGRVLHMAPSSNYIDHGFYMFSPTLLWDYAHANAWEVAWFRFAGCAMADHDKLGYAVDQPYTPGSLDLVGPVPHLSYMNFVLLTKTPRTTGDRIPQQGAYAEGAWKRPMEEALQALKAALENACWDEAEARGRLAVQLFPNAPQAWLGLGCALACQGRPMEALPLVEKALGLEESPAGLALLAALHGTLGNLEARDSVQRYLEGMAGLSR